jgi:uncharacterized protein (DUF697 family)
MVSAGAIRKLLKEIEASAAGEHVLAFGGAIELAAVLRRQFLRGGADPGTLRLGGPEGAEAYIHVLTGEPGEEDELALRAAKRARVPVIAIVVGTEADVVPYVLATDIVRVAEGRAFPLAEIARVVANRLDEAGAPLAARVPILRDPVCERLVASVARKNGLYAAAMRIPGADLPVLTLNQLRLVLRIAQAYGEETGRERLPELLATLGAGFGLRAVAREALDAVPVAGWAVKGAVAYAGTRAVGEAARKRFALAPSATLPARLTRLRAAAVPVAP